MGAVSPSSVLAYVNGRTLPMPRSAMAIALVLGSSDGANVLRAWGMDEAASEVEDRHSAVNVGGAFDSAEVDERHSLTYEGGRLTPEEEQAVRMLIRSIRGSRDS